jgi:hypothetical protein
MNHAEKFLKYIFAEGSIVELRSILTDHTVVGGRFNDLTTMATSAADLDTWPEMSAIYYTLNPIHPDRAKYIGDYSANTLRSKVRSTGDRDVLRRENYLIDLDPVRPSGVCSTDDEKAATFEVADRVQAHLTERGWPQPIRIDSGNGCHLIYRGDGCDANSKAWAHVLKHLAATFDTDAVKVDTTVGNASRISRLPGTLNRKGENTQERPHRRCKVLSYPEEWTPVAHGPFIYRLACAAGFETVQREQTQRDTDRPELVDDIEEAIHDFIDEYPDQLQLAGEFERGGKKFFALTECPFVGRRHNGHIGKSSIVLTDTAVGYSCFSDECSGRGMRDLRQHLEQASGHRSKVKFYVGSSAEDRAVEEMEDYFRRMSATMLFRDDVSFDAETYDTLISGAITTADPADYGMTFESLRDAFYCTMVHRADDATDDAEQKRITDQACAAVDAEDLQAMGELLGAWELYLIARNGARPEKDRQDYTSWLKRMPGEHILTALEMKWIVEGEDSRAA